MEVVVSAPLCPLYAAASAGAERSDELLCGWTAELLEEFSTGWCRVRTKYRYEGWARREHLRPAGDWTGRNKRPVRAPFADVLARPEVESPVLDTLPRGALAAPVGEAGEGWQKIALPDGREGYTKCSLWEDDYKTPPAVSEEALRARAVEVALSYQGTQYRWGGKSPLGVDCSGLTFMAWFFCGVSLYRDARLVDGFPARPIPFEARKPGDSARFPRPYRPLSGERPVHPLHRPGGQRRGGDQQPGPRRPGLPGGSSGKAVRRGQCVPAGVGAGGCGHPPLPLVRLSVGAALGAASSFVISGGGT